MESLIKCALWVEYPINSLRAKLSNFKRAKIRVFLFQNLERQQKQSRPMASEANSSVISASAYSLGGQLLFHFAKIRVFYFKI